MRTGLIGTGGMSNPPLCILVPSMRRSCIQMVRHGWVVARAGDPQDTRKPPGRFWGGAAGRDVPVLVHRRSDEKTLTAAAGLLSRGGQGGKDRGRGTV